MLEAKLRDINLKGRKFRNEGMAIGTVKRLNGDVIPVALLSRKVDKYLADTNDNPDVVINFEGEEIRTRIVSSKRHVLLHNTVNIDFIEVE